MLRDKGDKLLKIIVAYYATTNIKSNHACKTLSADIFAISDLIANLKAVQDAAIAAAANQNLEI